MSGFCDLYELPGKRTLFNQLINTFERHGIHLEFPGSQDVHILEEEGETFIKSRDWLIEKTSSCKEVYFEWWLAEDTDICCGIRFEEDHTFYHFGLDGFTQEDLVLFLRAILEYSQENTQSGIAFGLVVDRYDVTEDYDWDQFFFHQETIDTQDFPDLLCIPSELEKQIVNVPADYSRKKINNTLFFHKE